MLYANAHDQKISLREISWKYYQTKSDLDHVE